MMVGVDQARRDQAAGAVDASHRAVEPAGVPGADRDDAPVVADPDVAVGMVGVVGVDGGDGGVLYDDHGYHSVIAGGASSRVTVPSISP